ncbi:MAG: hypothetical protein HQM13_15225 [SAR324 cluster bacterium]|nr:hypothetical protein [SAR324 cluster bacterium]
MNELILSYSKMVSGDVLVYLIIIAFFIGLVILFIRHYLVESEHRFATALHRRTHELINQQYKEEKTKEFSEIVWYVLRKASSEREQIETNAKKESAGPFASKDSGTSVSSGPFGGGKSKEASSKDAAALKSSQVKKPKPTFRQVFRAFWDERLSIEQGIQKIIENTLEQTMYYKLNQAAPNFLNIATYAFTYNPYFQKILKFISVGTANSLLKTWHEILVMIGILGTFVGFFLAFSAGGDLKVGVTTAITSSIAGLTLGIAFMFIEKSFPDDETSLDSVEIFKDSLELIWNNSKTLYEE